MHRRGTMMYDVMCMMYIHGDAAVDLAGTACGIWIAEYGQVPEKVVFDLSVI